MPSTHLSRTLHDIVRSKLELWLVLDHSRMIDGEVRGYFRVQLLLPLICDQTDDGSSMCQSRLAKWQSQTQIC